MCCKRKDTCADAKQKINLTCPKIAKKLNKDHLKK